MNFDDLNDEIGADDWLIPKREITRRKLIKQTSRFKIYKADWFGDVLVYEPIRHNLASRRHSHRASYAPSSDGFARTHREIDQAAFRSKLNELCLDLRGRQAKEIRAPSSPSASMNKDDAGEEQVDSAYSSVSTTPQYHTKHNMSSQCEFAFPSIKVTQATVSVPDASQQEMKSTSGNSNSNKSACCLSPANSPPVVLNRDSFTFGHLCNNSEPDTSNYATEDKENVISAREANQTQVATTTTTSSGWFELNELRLVAHENFMLFMGASMNNEEVRTMNESMEHNASLVMQMSHPKSISLRDLLHANNNNNNIYTSCNGAYSSTSSSPINRFFSARFRPQPRTHLTVEAKLNICQQVTNAMTYLHEKNIVHGRLTSVNIYIELNQRVKISLLDSDEQQIVATGDEQSCRLNLPALTYLSPELIRSLRVIEENCDNRLGRARPEVHMDTRLITREADIFAFGTLLFELFEERFPFAASPTAVAHATPAFASPEARHAANAKLFDTLCLESPSSQRCSPTMFNNSPGWFSMPTNCVLNTENHHRRRLVMAPAQGNIKLSASELIYQIGSGQIAARNARSTKGNVPALVDHIISACWAREAHARPSFKQLKFE